MVRGVSSAGRASALQAEGHRFDPGTLHKKSLAFAGLFLSPGLTYSLRSVSSASSRAAGVIFFNDEIGVLIGDDSLDIGNLVARDKRKVM
jgi:hypothetical protein